MTVHPPLAVIPDWGPSLTFISKPGGYKYVTDQHAALQAHIWNKGVEEEVEQEEERDRQGMQVNDNWNRMKDHKQKDNEYNYQRLGRQRDPKTRTEFQPHRAGHQRGKYSAVGN